MTTAFREVIQPVSEILNDPFEGIWATTAPTTLATETGELNSGQAVFAMFPFTTYPDQSCLWTCGFLGCFFPWQLLYRSLKANLMTSVVNLVTNQISRQKQYRRKIYKPHNAHTHTQAHTRTQTNPKKQITHPSQFPGIGITKYCDTMEHYTLVKKIMKFITEAFVCFSLLIFNKLLNRRSNLT